jgi:serine/threonine protein kinase
MAQQRTIERPSAIAPFWPSPQDFNEAVQTPQQNFSDVSLKAARADERLGLPRAISGAFASVYKLTSENSTWAVKCFLRRIEDQAQRYEKTNNCLQADSPGSTIPFSYLSQGIKVNGHWFPVLKMEWIEGQTLDEFATSILYSTPELAFGVAHEFLELHQNLRNSGIAHGDLQHANIMMTQNGLRLVDYDGMFVPGMEGLSAVELGHRHYQHPARRAHHFGKYIDDFPAWIIYSSLLILATDPSLFSRFRGESDYLIFNESDLRFPQRSLLFHQLDQHADKRLARLSRFLRLQLATELDQVTPLQEDPPEVAIRPHAQTCECFHGTVKPQTEPWWRNMSLDQASAWGRPALSDIEPEVIQKLPRRVQRNWNCGQKVTWNRLSHLNSALVCLVVAVTGFVHEILVDPLWLGLNVVVYVVLAFVFELCNWREPFRDLRLLSTGTVSVATVTAKDQSQRSLRYYFTANGRRVEGTLYLTRQAWESVGAGQQLTILYNASDAREHCVYRFAYYMAV